jgi:hypothetical protein
MDNSVFLIMSVILSEAKDLCIFAPRSRCISLPVITGLMNILPP